MIRWLYYFLRRQWYRRIYLKSRHWREFRKEALSAANWRCSHPGCPAVDPHTPHKWKAPMVIAPLDIHHRTYENLGHEKLEEVDVFCRRHHREIEAAKNK